MSLEETKAFFSNDAGEFISTFEQKDYSEYRKQNCIMVFYKKENWLVKASVEVFSHFSSSSSNTIQKDGKK